MTGSMVCLANQVDVSIIVNKLISANIETETLTRMVRTSARKTLCLTLFLFWITDNSESILTRDEGFGVKSPQFWNNANSHGARNE